MKATKYFLILLAVVALFAFACKTKDEPAPDPVDDPVEQWMGEVKAVLETWSAKEELTEEELEQFTALIPPLMAKAADLNLENLENEEQKAEAETLAHSMQELIDKFIPTPPVGGDTPPEPK